MEHLITPAGYKPVLDLRETQVAIKEIKDFFQRELAKQLNLTRVSAPLFVLPESGLNDNLNGVERPVSFGILEQKDRKAEIVHSLAKWKRQALKEYGFQEGEGLYTDMMRIQTTSIPFMWISGTGRRSSVKKIVPVRHWNPLSVRFTRH